MKYIIEFVIGFSSSLCGFVVALHFDLAGRWEQRHIAKGQKQEEKRLPPQFSHIIPSNE